MKLVKWNSFYHYCGWLNSHVTRVMEISKSKDPNKVFFFFTEDSK